jgi:hypothetical protein
MKRFHASSSRLMFFLGAAALLAPLFAHADTTFKGVPSKGTLVGSGNFALNSLSRAALLGFTTKEIPHFTPRRKGNTAAAQGAVPQVDSSSVQKSPSAVLANFNGISDLASAIANGGILVEPPDQGLCVGNFLGHRRVFEIVNIAIAEYTPAGTQLAIQDINSLFNEPEPAFNGELVSDPRCIFDKSTDTFFFTVVASNLTAVPPPANLESHVDIIVVNGTTGMFAEYKFDTTDLSNPLGDCPCLDDQPKVGIDNNAIYIGADEFSLTSNLYNGAELLVISKPQLVSAASSVNAAYFINLTLAGIPVLDLMPAISVSSTNTEYLENSFPFDAVGNPVFSTNLIGLWRVTDDSDVTSGGMPNLSAKLVKTETYAIPVNAATTPAGNFLNTNDDRMGQLEFIDGNLWSCVETSVNINGTIGEVVGAAWFKINAATRAVDKQGYVATKGQYLIYPTILHTSSGLTTINFTITNPTLNPSAAFVRLSSSNTIEIEATGVSPYSTFAFRWGDYSWAALDPDGVHIWMGNEYVPAVSDQAPIANWGTEIFEQ